MVLGALFQAGASSSSSLWDLPCAACASRSWLGTLVPFGFATRRSDTHSFRTLLYTYTHTYTYTCADLDLDTVSTLERRERTYVYIYVHTYVCIYIFIHMYIYVFK